MSTLNWRLMGWISCLICSCGLVAGAATLSAGAHRVEITPPANLVPTWGYGGPTSKAFAHGSLDPLYAHILYMKAPDGTAFAWVDLDCGRPPGIPTQQRIRMHLASLVPHIFFSATHTHSGPFFLDDRADAVIPDWEKEMIDQIEGGIRTAAQHAAPAMLKFASGSAVIGYNRRLVRADGSITMLAGIDGNKDRLATGPIDPTFSVLRVDGESGQPIAIVVNATAHPVIRVQKDLFSADYPGVVRQLVSDGFPSHPVCLFLQGAAGDINPQRPGGANLEKDDGVQQLGHFLGEKVLTVARAASANQEAEHGIRIMEDPVSIDNRWTDPDFKKEFATFVGYVDHFGPHAQLPVAVILLNRDIAWVSFPGEMFVQLQTYFRVHCPLARTLFAGYSNGYFGYFPTIEAAATGGYGANNIMATAAPGAGETLVNRALIDIDRLLGRLRDTPARAAQPYESTWPRH